MPPSNTNTEIALLKQETQYIKEGVARLEKKQDEQHTLLYNMLKSMNESFSNNFATKEELEPIKEKQKEHDKIFSTVGWGAVITLISIAGGIIGITNFM